MEIKNLSFSYGQKQIFSGLNLQFKRGRVTTLIGTNGCGKSTLFNLLTKNLIYKEGSMTLNGQEIKKTPLMKFARKAAIVHQYNTAPEDLKVRDLVAYGRMPHCKGHHGRDYQKDVEKIEWAMEVTGVSPYQNEKMGALSGGQRQRVWIAMALAQEPEILFLDEPTTYLDLRYQIEILKLVQKLNQAYNMTIVMILHDLNQALHYSDELIALKSGQIVAQGTPEEVITAENLHEVYGISLNIKEVDGCKQVMMW